LLALARPRLADRCVVDVRVGLALTAARLDDGSVGLAATLGEGWAPAGAVLEAGVPRPAGELACLVGSCHAVDVSVGMAVINAGLNRAAGLGTDADLLDLLAVQPDERVVMVGFFPSFARRLEGRCHLRILERRRQDERVLPDWACEQVLPAAEVAIITGSAVHNRTLDHLLGLVGKGCRVAVAGPSAALVPQVFAPRGVRYLGGAVVTDGAGALRGVSLGGAAHELKPYVRKVTLVL
jgi:uncharacterized protein (DUF4213/DUF364 family)